MKLQVLGLFTLFTCIFAAYGCRDASVSSPTAGETDTERLYVRGRVTDPAGRPIAGAVIDVLQGAEPGRQTATTDSEGKFELAASSRMARVDVAFRVSRQGFVPRIVDTAWRSSELSGELSIWLDTGPAIDLPPGAYTLTVSFNLERARAPSWSGPTPPPCAGFPAALASRSYRVEVSPATWTPSLDDRVVRIENAPFPFGDRFVLSIIGRYIALEEMDDLLTEELPNIRFLGIAAGGPPTAEPATVTGTSVSFRFQSEFRYCELRFPLGHYHECSQVPAEGIVDFRACASDDAVMTFAPR